MKYGSIIQDLLLCSKAGVCMLPEIRGAGACVPGEIALPFPSHTSLFLQGFSPLLTPLCFGYHEGITTASNVRRETSTMGTPPKPPAPVEELEKHRLAKPERLFHEINLLHLEGHYFAFDPKAANVFPDPMKSVEKRLENPKINEEQPIEVIPHPGYGKPSVFAYKVYQASLKKLSDYGYPVPEGVSFGHRELMRLVGRTSTGGKNSKELVRVLNQFRNTAINCWFYSKHTKTAANLSFSLANRFLYTYKSRGSISQVTLWLDPLLIKSINNHYTFCLNFGRMENLGRSVRRSTSTSTFTSRISTARSGRRTLPSGKTTRKYAVRGSEGLRSFGTRQK
jgi:Replication initiator protein A